MKIWHTRKLHKFHCAADKFQQRHTLAQPLWVTWVTITFSTNELQHFAAASSALFVTWVNLRQLNAITMLLRVGSPGRRETTWWFFFFLCLCWLNGHIKAWLQVSLSPSLRSHVSTTWIWALTCFKQPQLTGQSISCWWGFNDISCHVQATRLLKSLYTGWTLTSSNKPKLRKLRRELIWPKLLNPAATETNVQLIRFYCSHVLPQMLS